MQISSITPRPLQNLVVLECWWTPALDNKDWRARSLTLSAGLQSAKQCPFLWAVCGTTEEKYEVEMIKVSVL